MSPDEVEAFRANPYHAEAVRLRRYDEEAKDPRATHARLRPLPAPRRGLQIVIPSVARDLPYRSRRNRDVEAAWGLHPSACAPHAGDRTRCRLAGRRRRRSPLKLESLQVSGSFKGRGAFHKLLASKVPAAGIIAASGGNHGAAAAYAARALGHKAEIFVPTIAAPAKVARLRSYGAVVHQIGAVYAEARAASEKRAAETGALMVPAYEDEVVFAGAGSVALEFAEQAEFDTLLVAVGGGGLIAGCAAAIGDGEEDRRRRDRGHADAARRR